MNEKHLLEWISQSDTHYHPNAYFFVLEALRYTQCYFKKPRHISGHELLIGIARFGKKRYDNMAYMVFKEWGVESSRDFGNIVFNLVEMGEVKKTDEDSIDDFDVGFDLKSELSRMETIS